MWTLLLFILCVLLLLASAFLNIRLYQQKNEMRVKRDHYKDKLQQIEFELKRCEERSTVKLSAEAPVKSISTEVVPLSDEGRMEDTRTSAAPSGLTLEWDIPNAEQPVLKKREHVFFQRPVEDGYFQISEASNEHKARFVYKIELNDDGSLGVLHLDVTNPSDIDLLRNFPETILQNACSYVNPFSNNFQSIVQVAPGAVIVDGDGFRITEKVKIQFI